MTRKPRAISSGKRRYRKRTGKTNTGKFFSFFTLGSLHYHIQQCELFKGQNHQSLMKGTILRPLWTWDLKLPKVFPLSPKFNMSKWKKNNHGKRIVPLQSSDCKNTCRLFSTFWQFPINFKWKQSRRQTEDTELFRWPVMSVRFVCAPWTLHKAESKQKLIPCSSYLQPCWSSPQLTRAACLHMYMYATNLWS